ncbi:MAG: GTPase domain-containing protein, partial [Planctomycetes bacterium]|nr:GTPase domain-containing protein [Planctomycetota bacterium]
MSDEVRGATLALTLLSHTNVGKTTLARTLLRKDVGEVLDEAHVTDEASAHVLLEAPGGERLVLWDSPGFGDSVRLLRTLRAHADPLAWIQSQHYDRHEERALYCDREALSTVRRESDVVLYLVNASERPEDAGYVQAELELLAWIERPVIVLLNQTGPPRALETSDDERRWREATARWRFVKGVLGLDAFTRCWVQEGRLFEEVRAALPPERRELATLFLETWRRERQAAFRAAMDLFAGELLRAAADEEPVVEGAWGNDKAQAMRALSTRMEQGTATVVDRLIGLHGLEGRAEVEFRAVVDDFKARHEKLAPKRWGLVGGVASGLLTGLGADLA